MRTLKPCPFCGGEAELCYGPGLGTDSCRGYTLQAGCNDCGAKSPGLWQEKKPELNDQLWKDAADEWNYRPGETAETCGIAYCEHYPEGLPVCAKCREESTLAHDKACAELADKDKQLAEARAEILRIKHCESAASDMLAAREALIEQQRAEIERLKNEHENSLDKAKNYMLELSGTITKQAGELFAKNKLIEQMREALKACAEFIHYYDQEYNIGDGKALGQAIAALSAAERGE